MNPKNITRIKRAAAALLAALVDTDPGELGAPWSDAYRAADSVKTREDLHALANLNPKEARQ